MHPNRWTPERLSIVEKLYPTQTAREIAHILGDGFTKSMVIAQANSHGWYKGPSYTAPKREPRSYRIGPRLEEASALKTAEGPVPYVRPLKEPVANGIQCPCGFVALAGTCRCYGCAYREAA